MFEQLLADSQVCLLIWMPSWAPPYTHAWFVVQF
jgi:hypothetical protein